MWKLHTASLWCVGDKPHTDPGALDFLESAVRNPAGLTCCQPIVLCSRRHLMLSALPAEMLKGSSQRKTGNSFKESNVDKGMVLPFTPLTMTFHDVHYFVDCPPVCTWCPLFWNPPLFWCSSSCFGVVFLAASASKAIGLQLRSVHAKLSAGTPNLLYCWHAVILNSPHRFLHDSISPCK